MAIKELFNDARPQVLFDPRASQRIDPRFKFTRDGVASYYDSQGILRYAPANQARVNAYEPDENGVMLPTNGLIIEAAGTNLVTYSEQFDDAAWLKTALGTGVAPVVTANSATAPDGAIAADKIDFNRTTATSSDASYIQSNNLSPSAIQYAGSVWVKAATAGDVGKRIQFRHVSSSGTPLIHTLTLDWQRIDTVETGVAGTRRLEFGLINAAISDTSVSVHAWGAQVEASSYPTSYIPTAGSTVTREPDLLSVETPLPSTGSIYIDARSLGSDVDTTLLSAAPASPSTDKLALAIREPADLYNSKALVYEVDGAFKPTLPFPVPSNAQERNLITYGANNYHYRSDSARYTPSSSTSVPANMTRLGIGHDVTDPTKAMTGYINAVYLWPGEITPTVAEALVRGDVDPKDADAGVFTPAAGSLAFVFNTQGTATDGDTVVQLPLRGSTNNVLVDWGDNTSSSLIGAAASVTVNHTYPSAGIYPVQITADDDGTNSGLSALEFYDNSPADLVRVLQWGGSTTFQPTTMYRIFRDCTQMDFENDARTNLPDTSGCSDWREAFRGCSSLSGQYPNFDHSGATQLSSAWYGCSGITSFGSSLNDLNTGSSYVLDYTNAWRGCSGITDFPAITIPNDQGAVSLAFAWEGCSGLTSFPNSIDTSAVTNFGSAWKSCSNITAFSTINTAAGTNFSGSWRECSGITSFTLSNFSSATTLQEAFFGWTSFTGTFSAITTSNALTTLLRAWRNNKMTVFGPPSNTSQVTNFYETWRDCSGLTSFPLIDTSSGVNFFGAWHNCSSLTDFPANFFDSWSPASIADQCFHQTWDGCTSLTPASVVNILNSIAASGQSAPSGTGTHDKKITIDWDGTGDPATDAAAAITTLKSRNWQIYLNNVLQ